MYTPIFNITNKLLSNVAAIEAAKEIIVNAPLIPLWERNFRQEALVRTIHFSTQIEGNDLSIFEAERIAGATRNNRIVGNNDKDVLEVINYRKVMQYISDNFDNYKSEVINRRILLDIHSIVVNKLIPENEIGRFRRVNVNLVNSYTGEISFKPPDYKRVKTLVDELFEWFGSEEATSTSAIIKAGVIHYVLMAIHPFTEGNGRTARAMATLSLFKDGYDIKSFFSLDEFYARDAKRYYEELRKTDELKWDLTNWLEYFSEGVASELTKVKDRILNISKDVKMKNRFGQIFLSERQIQIISYLEKNGSISNKEWRVEFPNLSDDTILRDINYLVSNSIVVKKGSTRGAVYILA